MSYYHFGDLIFTEEATESRQVRAPAAADERRQALRGEAESVGHRHSDAPGAYIQGQYSW